MKARLVLPVIMVIASFAIAGAQIEPPADTGVEDPDRYKYVVRRGDTLWDLASRFFDNPYKWPRIWQSNPNISDPHWIYPGDVLMIIPEPDEQQDILDRLPVEHRAPEYAEAGSHDEVEYVARPIGEKNSVTFTPSHLMGFLSSTELEAIGKIYSGPQEKAVYGTWELVYVDIGKDNNLKLGNKFSVIRPVTNILHPVTEEEVGFMIRTIGALKITKVDERMSEAQITESNEEIQIGDLLVPLSSAKKTVRFVDIDQSYHREPLEAVIVCSQAGKSNFAREDIVYIDVGKNHKVKPGNLFEIYLPSTRYNDPETGRQVKVPEKVVGRLVLMVVGDNYSTALIDDSTQEFEVGATIRSRRYRGKL